MKPTVCILLDGTEEQKQNYLKQLDKIGEVTLAKSATHMIQSILKGKYVIVDLSKIKNSVGVILNTSRYYGSEVVGYSFKNGNTSSEFDRFFIGGSLGELY